MSVLAPIRADVADSLGIPRGVDVGDRRQRQHRRGVRCRGARGRAGAIMMGTTGVLTVHHAHRHVDPEASSSRCRAHSTTATTSSPKVELGGKLIELASAEVFGGEAVDRARTRFTSVRRRQRPRRGSWGVLFLPWVFGSVSPALDLRHRGAFARIVAQHVDRRRGAGDAGRNLDADALARRRGRAGDRRGVRVDPVRRRRRPIGPLGIDHGGRPRPADDQVANPRHANARGAGSWRSSPPANWRSTNSIRSCPSATFEPRHATRHLCSERLGVYRDLHRVLAEPVARLTN